MKKKLLIAFTIFYVIFEVIYNLGLVEFLTSKNTEIRMFEHLETFGKTLSSIGLSLILIHLVKNSKSKIIAFAILVPTLYIAETVGFNHFVNSLPKDVKVAGYVNAVYRNAVINSSIKDERFAELTPYNRVVLSNIMSLSNDHKQIEQNVTRLLYQEPDQTAFTALYANYQGLTSTIEPYYATYAIESKRWNGWNGKAKEIIDREFMKRTGGLKQGLNKDQFFEAVAEKSPSFKTYQDAIVIPGNSELGIVELRGKDIPLGMGQEQFNGFVSSKFKDIIARSRITEANVEKLPHSFDLISSVFIPPLAILLSLMSILLNTGLLLSEFGAHAGRFIRTPLKIALGLIPTGIALFVFATYTHNPYKLPEALNRVTGVEASLYQVMQPVAQVIHAVAINDQHPNEDQVIRIKKPEPINFKDLEDKMNEFKTSTTNQDLPQIDSRITADSDKLEHDKGYFGEIKTRSNPYTN